MLVRIYRYNFVAFLVALLDVLVVRLRRLLVDASFYLQIRTSIAIPVLICHNVAFRIRVPIVGC